MSLHLKALKHWLQFAEQFQHPPQPHTAQSSPEHIVDILLHDHSHHAMTPSETKDMCSAEATALFEAVCKVRSSSNLTTLTFSKTLQALAEAHAESLSKEPKLRPSTPNLDVPYGENLHRCRHASPSTDAFNAWSRKAYARKNLYSSQARFAGVGVVEAQGYVNMVMMFTKQDPDKGEASELGSDGSCTSISAIVLSDQEVMSGTDWSADKENSLMESRVLESRVLESSGTGIFGKENHNHNQNQNQNPGNKKLMPETKALDIAQDAFNYMNGARKDIDVHYLRWDDGLYKQALAHTERMVKLGRVVHSGKHRFENVVVIDKASSKKAGKLLMEKFLRRRENMLSSSFQYCAIAVIGDEQKSYATQLFSRERV